MLVAVHPSLRYPKIMLIDFERSRHFLSHEDGLVDVWWYERRFDPPPEGTRRINGFQFDMYCLGHAFYGAGPSVSVVFRPSLHY